MTRSLALLALGACMSTAVAQPNPAVQNFQKVSDEYFDKVYFPNQPTVGTLTGYHEYDVQLEDYSHKKIDAWVADLVYFERRIESIPPAGLDETTRGDREMVLANIRSTLLTLDTIRTWERNPDAYSGGVSNAAFSLMERKFAPPNERLRSLIAREKLMPSRLDEARVNLKNPPRVSTDISIEQLPGIISFFEKDVPSAFTDAKDPALKAELPRPTPPSLPH